MPGDHSVRTDCNIERVTLVLCGLDDGVARITLNRPEALNAWTPELGRDLLAAVRRASEDPGARALRITGAGRAFSAGADVKSPRETLPNGDPDLSAPPTRDLQPDRDDRACHTQARDRGGQRGRGWARVLAGPRLRPDCGGGVGLLSAGVRTPRGHPPTAGLHFTSASGPARARAAELMMLWDRPHAGEALEWGW
jgi:2-(1,2-epoxy-1,2-dihydrophenyl)acetyl-CoA isomerase